MWLRSARIITPAGARAGTIMITGGRISDVRLDRDGTRDSVDGADLGGGRAPAHGADLDAGRDPANGADLDAGRDPHPRLDPSPGLDPDPGLDLGDRWIAPGFIDTHVHGGGGAQCNTSDPDEILAVAQFHAIHGTTSLLATTVAAPLADLEAALRAIATAADRPAPQPAARCTPVATILGAHLEGPFLSRSHAGAMDPAHFQLPNRDVWARLLGVSPGTLTMITIAPELPGALELIAAAARAGVIVSLGHSDATYEQARDGTRAGASAVTHLFNAMRPMHHRDPGIVGAALDLPELSCELICDGHHVAEPVLRVAARAKGTGGVRLVTDAIEAAGMPDGEYRLGSGRVEVRHGRAVTPGSSVTPGRAVTPGSALAPDGEHLAGSTLTMQDAVRNAVSMLGISVETAASLASANPARLLGIADRKGSIAPGMDADLVVLGDDLNVERTMVAGEWVA